MPMETLPLSAEFNHTIVLTRDREKSARFLAGVPGLEVGEPAGMFLPVTTANGSPWISRPPISTSRCSTTRFSSPRTSSTRFLPGWWVRGSPSRRIRTGRSPGASTAMTGGGGVYFRDPAGHGLEVVTRPYGADPESPLNGVTEEAPGGRPGRLSRAGPRGRLGWGSSPSRTPPSVPSRGLRPRTPAPRTPEGLDGRGGCVPLGCDRARPAGRARADAQFLPGRAGEAYVREWCECQSYVQAVLGLVRLHVDRYSSIGVQPVEISSSSAAGRSSSQALSRRIRLTPVGLTPATSATHSTIAATDSAGQLSRLFAHASIRSQSSCATARCPLASGRDSCP